MPSHPDFPSSEPPATGLARLSVRYALAGSALGGVLGTVAFVRALHLLGHSLRGEDVASVVGVTAVTGALVGWNLALRRWLDDGDSEGRIAAARNRVLASAGAIAFLLLLALYQDQFSHPTPKGSRDLVVGAVFFGLFGASGVGKLLLERRRRTWYASLADGSLGRASLYPVRRLPEKSSDG